MCRKEVVCVKIVPCKSAFTLPKLTVCRDICLYVTKSAVFSVNDVSGRYYDETFKQHMTKSINQ